MLFVDIGNDGFRGQQVGVNIGDERNGFHSGLLKRVE